MSAGVSLLELCEDSDALDRGLGALKASTLALVEGHDGAFIEGDGWWAGATGFESPWLNVGALTGGRSPAARMAAIAGLRRCLSSAGATTGALWVPGPAPMEGASHARGHEVLPLMRRLPHQGRSAGPPPHVRIERVYDRETAAAAARLVACSFPLPGMAVEQDGRYPLFARSFLERDEAQLWVAWRRDELASVAVLTPSPSGAYVDWVTTRPEFRRVGIARSLVDACSAAAGTAPIFLHATSAARALYSSMGFELVRSFAAYRV
jgi:GNAT superfamily N-acetyltransferase